MIRKTLLVVLMTGTVIAAPSVLVNAFYSPIGPVGIFCQHFDPYNFEGKACTSPFLSSPSPPSLFNLQNK